MAKKKRKTNFSQFEGERPAKPKAKAAKPKRKVKARAKAKTKEQTMVDSARRAQGRGRYQKS